MVISFILIIISRMWVYFNGKENFLPKAGDIVIYDRVFENM